MSQIGILLPGKILPERRKSGERPENKEHIAPGWQTGICSRIKLHECVQRVAEVGTSAYLPQPQSYESPWALLSANEVH